MPKQLIRRYLPNPEKIARTPGLGFLKHRLEDPNLWHLNRRSASGAMFWGLWCAFLPMPFQTVPAAIAALVFRVNLPLAIVLCWVSNPLTMLPVIFVGYDIGALLLKQPLLNMAEISKLIGQLGNLFGSSPEAAANRVGMANHIEPFLLGMMVTGFLAGCLGYLGMNWYWRRHVTRAWLQRRKRQSASPPTAT
ncbi:DUF2062 domain-containing protein [Fluviicoccus keumensis]|nr:DUF2062 domain-containing protein [Fluviicoccus keumensis]